LGEELWTSIPYWIQSQMDPNAVPPTYHREAFRRQVGSAMREGRASRTGAPKHPCAPDSRWRRHSFTMYDHGKQDVKISIIPDGRRLITVNGIPRTVVPSLQLEKYDSNGNRYYEDAPEGNYYLCWLIEEKVGGYFEVAPDGGSCYRTREGNPVVDLPDNILDDYSSVIPRLDLPALDNFIELDPILYGDYWYPILWGGAGYMYNSSLHDYAGVDQCNALPFGDFSNLLGLFSSGERILRWSY